MMKCKYCNFEINRPGRLHYRMCYCKKAVYCDRDCQKNHLNEHKAVCHLYLKAASTADSDEEFDDEKALKRLSKVLPCTFKSPLNPPSPPGSTTSSADTQTSESGSSTKNSAKKGKLSRSKALGHKSDSNLPSTTKSDTPSIKKGVSTKPSTKTGVSAQPSTKKDVSAQPGPKKDVSAHPSTKKGVSSQTSNQLLNSAHRDTKTGQFTPPNPGKQTEKQRKNATRVKNGRDFTAAKNKLKSIIDRNRKEGVNWEFKIESQKKSKASKHQYHCWKSTNFTTMALDSQQLNSPSSEDEADESVPMLHTKRVCTNCKNPITGPQWSYLVCRGDGCKNGMTHFQCIGFPDVSQKLNKMMKQEYECPRCHLRREAEDDQEADFQPRQPQSQPQKKKRKRAPNPRLSEMLKQNREKKLKKKGGTDEASDQDSSFQSDPNEGI